MSNQLHKRFSTEELKILLRKYLSGNVKLMYILEILKITPRQFFRLLKAYRKDPENFSIEYKRKRPTRKISAEIEKNIIAELTIAKRLIEDKDIPITFYNYNYSYIKDQLEDKYQQRVSLSTIIERAKKENFIYPGERRTHSMIGKFQPSTLASSFSTIPRITSSPPMQIRSGVLLPVWMITVEFPSMPGWWKENFPGIISWPYKIYSLPGVFLCVTMWILTLSSALSRKEIVYGDVTTF